MLQGFVDLKECLILFSHQRKDIKKWPDILTLQLKRPEMKYTQTGFNYGFKNESKVEIRSRIQVKFLHYIILHSTLHACTTHVFSVL